MTKEKYLECTQLLIKNKGKWYQDDDCLIVLYHPEEAPVELQDAVMELNKNTKEGDKVMEEFYNTYGNPEVRFEFDGEQIFNFGRKR